MSRSRSRGSDPSSSVQQVQHVVGAQLETGVAELLEQVAQLLGDLDVVGQHELARRLPCAERRARHHGGRAQAHDQRVAGGRGRAPPRGSRGRSPRRARRRPRARPAPASGRSRARGRRAAPSRPAAIRSPLLQPLSIAIRTSSAPDSRPRWTRVRPASTSSARSSGARRASVLARPYVVTRSTVGNRSRDPADDRRELLRLDRARVRVLQEDRARAVAAGRATPGRPHCGTRPSWTAADAAAAQHLRGLRHRVHVREHVLDRPQRRLRALVHGAERAAVPGAVADRAHQQAVRLAGRADGALLERRRGQGRFAPECGGPVPEMIPEHRPASLFGLARTARRQRARPHS